MPLTNTACKNAKPRKNAYKIGDSDGLYMLVNPNGSKYWRFKYRFLGLEKLLALGVYDEVSLADARQRRDAARKLVASGIDPAAARKQDRREAMANAANTFEKVAREWHGNKQESWKPKTGAKILRYLENDIFPHIGSTPIADIEPPDLLDVIRKVEARGAYYNAGRMKQLCGQIFRFGVATSKCKRDVAADLKDALKTRKTKHYAALDSKELPDFLKALEKNDARLFGQTRRGIRLLMLLFVRTGELINAEWDEFNFEKKEWHVPASRMKMGKPLIVPLSRQAIALLKEQKEATKHLNTKWCFPNQVRPASPMSNNTILFGIGRLGYKSKMTGHGFRAVARTMLREELNYDADVIEAQLAHKASGPLGEAYNRAQHLDKRRKMMQHWSDYLDVLASGGKVVAGNFKKRA